MKRNNTLIFKLFFGFLMLIQTTNVQASHIMGGDLTYTCIGPNTYEIQMQLYEDCNGFVNLGDPEFINITSQSCNQQLLNQAISLVNNPADVTPLCPGQATACGGNGQYGILQYTYKMTITLPANCPDWVISWDDCCRNGAITTLSGGGQSLYIETTLNNSTGQCNNSPNFLNDPTPFVCVGENVNYSHGVSELDGDSLAFSLINCLDDVNTSVNYAGSFSGTSPLTTSTGININPSTGAINFTPTAVEVGVICVLVEEYRNGQLIGEVMRDIQFRVLQCTNTLPVASGANGTATGAGTTGQFDLTYCEGESISFDVAGFDGDVGDIVSMDWNFGIPQGTFTVDNSVQPPVGTFTWNTTQGDAGLHIFTVNMTDNACPTIGINNFTFSITVLERPELDAGNAQVTCQPNTSVPLNATFNTSTYQSGSFSWTPTNGLSNPSSQFTTATPNTTTTYTASVTYSNGCTDEDEVIVEVTNGLNLPELSDTTICAGESVVLDLNIPNTDSTLFMNDTLVTIPDNDVAGGYSSINVSGISPTALNINSISSVCVTITHQASTDLDLYLISPDGIVLELSTDNGGFGDNYPNTCFSPTAATNIVTESPPYTGTYAPEGNFSIFNNSASNGIWKLWVVDDGAGFSGSIEEWSITFADLTTVSYDWWPNSLSCTNCATPTATPSSTTDYQVIATNQNGCMDTVFTTITINDTIPSPTVICTASMSNTLVFCWDTLNAVVGYEVNVDNTGWITPNGTQCHTVSGLNPLQTVNIQVRGVTTCPTAIVSTGTQSCTTPPCTLNSTMTATSVSCYGANDGTATVTPSGGTLPYSYIWTDGQTSATATNLFAGSHLVTVTDANGCSISDFIIITEPSALVLTLDSVNTSCTNDGMAIATASGGVGGYTYIWNTVPVQNTSTASNLIAGTYIVTVTDLNGCTIIDSIQVLNENCCGINAVVSTNNISCNQGNGNATVTVTGNTGAVTYTWNVGSNSSTITGLSQGTYTVTVTDAVCSVVESGIVGFQQTPNIEWENTIGGSLADKIDDIIETPDGGYIAIGHSASGVNGDKTTPNYGGFDYFIVKLDAVGNQIWDKTYGGSLDDVLFEIHPTGDGNYIIAGNSFSGANGNKTSGNKGERDIWIIKIDENGNKIFDRTYGGNLYDVSMVIQSLPDGGYIIGASSQSGINGDKTTANFGGSDYWLLRLDGNGNVLWDKSYGGTANDYLIDLELTLDGGFIFSGTCESGISGNKTTPNYGGRDVWVIKTDSHGTKEWEKNIGGSDIDWQTALEVLPSNEYLIGSKSKSSQNTGNKTASHYGDFDFWVIKLDSLGNEIWEQAYGENDDDGLIELLPLDDGNYMLVGRSNSNSGSIKSENSLGDSDAWLIKIDSSGTKLWDKSFGGTAYDEFESFQQASDGGFILAGSSFSDSSFHKSENSFGGSDLWVVKLNKPELFVDLGNDTTICSGSTLILDAGTGFSNYYWWPTGDTTQIITITPSNNTEYVVTVDDGICSISDTVRLTISTNVAPYFFSSDTTICSGQSIQFTNLSTGNISNISWDFGDGNTSTISNPSHFYTAEGTYIVCLTVLDANGCGDSTYCQPIVVENPIANFTANTTYSPCIPLDVSFSDASTNAVAWQWYFGDGTSSNAQNPTHTYTTADTFDVTLIVTSNSGCRDTLTKLYYIFIESNLSLNAASTSVSCLGLADGTATVSVNGGITPYTYTWSTIPIQTTATAIGLQEGVYFVTVTDAIGCSAMDTISIAAPNPMTLSTSSTADSCIGNGTATVSASGGTGGYTYSWNTIPIQTTATATNLSSGVYTFTVTDANNCTIIDTVVVGDNCCQLTVDAGADETIAINNGLLTLSGTPTGGTWSGTGVINTSLGIFDPQIAGLGTHLLTYTVNNGICQRTDTKNIVVNPITTSCIDTAGTSTRTHNGNPAGLTTIMCIGDNFTITHNNDGVTTGDGDPSTPAGIDLGIFFTPPTVSGDLVSDISGIGSANVWADPNMVNAPALMGTDQFGNVSFIHQGVFNNIYNAGSYVQLYFANVTLDNVASTPKIISEDVGGLNECVNISTNDVFSIVFLADIDTANFTTPTGGNLCQATIQVKGGLPEFDASQYSLALELSTNSTVKGTITSTSAFHNGTVLFNVPEPGFYNFIVTDNKGCTKVFQLDMTACVACSDDAGTATVSLASTASSMTANSLYPNDTLNITHNGNQNLGGDPNPLTPSGIQYAIYTCPPTTTGQTLADITTDPCIVTDGIGTIPQLIPNVDINGNGFIINNNTFYQSYLTNAGLTNPDTLWFAPITVDAFPPATWEGVGGANECTNVNIHAAFPVVFLNEISITGFNNTNAGNNCEGTITVTGGLPELDGSNYTLTISLISNPAITGSLVTGASHGGTMVFNVPQPGFYRITVSDNNGGGSPNNTNVIPFIDMSACSGTCSSFSLTGGISSNYNGANISCFGRNDGEITMLPTGGSYPYTYTWSHDNTLNDSIATGLGAGFYFVTVTDVNGCTLHDTITLVQPNPLFVNLAGDMPFCNGDNNGAVYVTPNTGIGGGTAPYNFIWSNNSIIIGTNNDTLNNVSSSPFAYQITATDVNGCTTSSSITIGQPTPITLSTSSTADSCIGNGTATVSASGGVGNYTYSWNTTPIQNTATATNLSSGTYTVIVTDANGCTIIDSVTVGNNCCQVTVNAGGNATYCETLSNITLSGYSPLGGVWSGPGIVDPVNGIFNGVQAGGVGTYNLVYTYGASQGCLASDILQVDVIFGDTVMAGANEAICIDIGLHTLSGYTPVGGIWSGTGIIDPFNGIFDPQTAGVGTHTLTYTYGSGTCEKVDTKIITVGTIPIVEAGSNENVCIHNPPFALSGYSPLGGTWSGMGIIDSSGIFDPQVTGIGTFTLTYTFTNAITGCTNFDTKTITVSTLPIVITPDTLIECNTSNNITLSGYSPLGGVWSGQGIVDAQNGIFNSTIAGGLGTYYLYYTYTNGNGCTSLDTTIMEIIFGDTVRAGANEVICIDIGLYTLSDYSPLGGTWSGVGIIDPINGIFDPIEAGAGVHTLSYTVNTGSCQKIATKTIIVGTPPIVNAGLDESVCIHNPPFALSGYSPLGGTWSGTGITDSSGIFDPQIAGLGVHILTYNYTNSITGCTSNSATKMITVEDNPSVNAGDSVTYCNTNQNIILNNYAPLGGIWSGQGIINASGIFNPQAAGGIGAYYLYYQYANPTGCVNSDTLVVTVIFGDTINAGIDQRICIDGGLLTLSGYSPIGGTWSGNGIVNTSGIFNPQLAGIGTHILSYTYGTGSCQKVATKLVTVDSLPFVNAGQDEIICENSLPFALTGYTPMIGTWSGIGITDSITGVFDAQIAGIGTYILTYTYTNPITNCTNSDTKTITVTSLPIVATLDSVEYCVGGGVISLSGYTPIGGIWTGLGIIDPNLGLFDPNSSGLGCFDLVYTYTDGNGCAVSDTMITCVIPNNMVDAGVNDTICFNDGIIILQGSPLGGTWVGAGIVNSTNVFDPQLAGVGTHQLTYTYGTGSCQQTDTRIITVSPTPVVEAGSNLIVNIVDPTFGLIGYAPLGGVWSGNGIIDPTMGLFNPQTAGHGLHQLTYTYTSPSGCIALDSISIQVDSVAGVCPTVNLGNDMELCSGSTITLHTGILNAIYLWNTGAITDSITISPTTDTTLFVTVVHLGRLLSDTIHITVIPSISYSLDSLLCNGETITINGTVYNENNLVGVEVFQNGSYQGCDSTVIINLSYLGTTPILVSSPIDITLSTTFDICGNTVNWIEPEVIDSCGNTILPAYQSHQPNQLFNTGTTTVTYIFDNFGDTLTHTFDITIIDDIAPVFVNCPIPPDDTIKSCDNMVSWIPLTATDNCGVLNISSTHQPNTYFPEGATDVYYIAEDINGNQDTCHFVIWVNISPQVSIDSIPVSCYNGNDGAALATVFTGQTPFTYSWSTSPVQTTSAITNLVAGQYELTITEGNGCSSVYLTTVPEPDPLMTTTISVADTNAQQIGWASVDVVGGTPPYSYQWNTNTTGSTTDTVYNLGNGMYLVTITDANNCITIDSVEVEGVFNSINNLGYINRLNVFPNPTNGRSTIELELTSAKNVRVVVHNTLGQLIKDFGHIHTSNLSYNLDFEKLIPGTYFIRFTIDDAVITKQLILIGK